MAERYVKYKRRESIVYEKRMKPTGETYEVVEGDFDPENGRLVGWRREVFIRTYQMPVDEFLQYASPV